MRVGIAHHFGWAVAVTASAGHRVVDRRRIELVEPGVPAAPVHHDGKPLDDGAFSALMARVRASALRATAVSLDELAAALPGPARSCAALGPPWTKDHRTALAATVLAALPRAAPDARSAGSEGDVAVAASRGCGVGEGSGEGVAGA
ncbi:hypothetical protein ACIBI7_29985 [Nonomuraea fuscirosea]|uniref:hypothetical protein n=1 Tax=Nonomuraea fuscirosea TaxID=1291556 RepID=UPI0037928971